jgi:hypothetical protein
MIEKIKTWITGNPVMAIGAAIVALFLLMPKMRRKLFKSAPRRRRRAKIKTVIRGNRMRTASRRPAKRPAAARSAAPAGRKGYAAAGGGTIPFKYNKNGTIKSAQFVAGTLAAKRRMASLRKNR